MNEQIIIITGFRPPKKGERFINIAGEVEECYMSGFGENRHIVATEIAVPENGVRGEIWLYDKHCVPIKHRHIPFSRPKIKRWLWVRDYATNYEIRTKEHLSEKEMEYMVQTRLCEWRKVEGSEIEQEV